MIDRWHPPRKLCSTPGCGGKNSHLKLSERSWTCLGCGTLHDRDLNAAKNILAAGLAVVQRELDKACGEDIRPKASPRGVCDRFVGCGGQATLVWLWRPDQISPHRPLASWQRRVTIPVAPRTFQRIPESLRRCPTTALQPRHLRPQTLTWVIHPPSLKTACYQQL